MWGGAQIGARCAAWLADPAAGGVRRTPTIRHYSDSSRLQVGRQTPAMCLSQPYLLSRTSARALGPESGPSAGSERLEAGDAARRLQGVTRRPTLRLPTPALPSSGASRSRRQPSGFGAERVRAIVAALAASLLA